jgi:hypothetical protein
MRTRSLALSLNAHEGNCTWTEGQFSARGFHGSSLNPQYELAN